MSSGFFVSTMLFGLLFLGLGVLVIAELVRSLVVSLTLPRGYRPHPACVRCGYDVRGLAQFTCPECGNDLRSIGIMTPAIEARRRGSTWGALLAWTVLVSLAASVMGNVVFAAAGLRSARAAQAAAATAAAAARAGNPAAPASASPATAGVLNQTTLDVRLTPRSAQYSHIDLQLLHTPAFGNQPVQTVISFALPGPGKGTASLNASSDQARGFNVIDPSGKVITTGLVPTRADVLAWLKAAGVDPAAPGVAEEADDLAAILAGAPSKAPNAGFYSGTAFSQGGVSITTSPVAATALMTALDDGAIVMLVVLAVAAVIWAVGLWLIVRRRRRMFAIAAA